MLQKVSNYAGTNPTLGKFLLGTSALSLVLATTKYLQSRTAHNEIEYRKQQLKKPIYRLSEEEMINPPWNKDNLSEWLYRRVEVTGRPLHRLACMIPRYLHGGMGAEYVVPLVAQESEDRAERQGIIFSKGFIPARMMDVGKRYRIQDVSRQTFIGFVSVMPELQNNSFFQGNAYHEGRLKYTCADMEDFVKSSGFSNKKQASVALVERLYQVGEVNERRGKRYSNDCDFADPYPYYKTEAGALQLPQMPWDLQNQAKAFFGISVATFIMGAGVF